MGESNEEKLQRALDLKRQGKKIDEEQQKLVDEYALKMADANESLNDRIKRLEKIKNQKKEELDLAEQLADMGLRLEGHLDTVYGAKEAELRLQRENIKLKENANEEDKKAYLLLLKKNTEEQNALKARKDAAEYTENAIARFTGISKKPVSGIAKMFANPEAFADGFKDSMGDVISVTNIMTSTVDKMVEQSMALAVEQDAAISNFRMATGATGEFDDEIHDLERSLWQAGVTSAEAGEAVQSLYLNVSGFSEAAPEVRKEMEGMVAVLAEVGVAAADSTRNIQIAVKGLGMSKTEATMLQSELRSFAQGINVSVSQLSKDFGEMGPQIVAMGDNGVEAFEKLQVTMKETGLEMQTVLKLVGQFDTFDGAAKSVGKLNALLGGPYLNTLELVSETDLGARMEKLREGVMDAGLAFDDLSYYQRKAYTSALGLNSEMELAMFLGNNMDSIIPEQKTAAQMEEMAIEAREFKDVMEELRQTGVAFAMSMRPFTLILKKVLNIIQLLHPILAPLVTVWGAWRLILAAKTMAMALHTKVLLANSAAQGVSISAEVAQQAPIQANIMARGVLTSVLGLNTTATWAHIAALGALLLVLAVVFMIIYVKAGSPSLIVALGILALAMFGLAYATNVLGWTIAPVIPVLYAFGGAMLMIGLGIGIAAAGMAIFVGSIVDLAGVNGELFQTALALLAVADALDEIPLTKTVALSAVLLPLAAMAPVAMVAAAGAGQITRGVGAASPAAAAAGGGGTSVINVHLDVDGDEFAASVNKVEVVKDAGNGMAQSIAKMFKNSMAS
tara:strand:+ start:1054 stop:3429 length:2376 start_codon:yes stop_codon:yes gene_type:complete